MKDIYEQFMKHINSLTPEQKAAEWEELKEYNEMGVPVEELISPDVKLNLITQQLADIDEKLDHITTLLFMK